MYAGRRVASLRHLSDNAWRVSVVSEGRRGGVEGPLGLCLPQQETTAVADHTVSLNRLRAYSARSPKGMA